jgi:hypothetical protein
VNSTWRYNRFGIVPNSQDVEELPPVYRNTYVGNVVYGNSNLEAATATNELYDAMVGSGIVMMGTQDSLVARNRVYDHEWFGIVLAPFPSDNLYTVDNTRVEGNAVENSRHADLALVFSNADQGNCFSRNEFTTSAPTEIEERVPCDGKFNADMTPGAVPPGDLLDRDEPEGKPYRDQPIPPPQPNMPDVDADPVPAPAGVVPLRIDVDAIAVPPKPAS